MTRRMRIRKLEFGPRYVRHEHMPLDHFVSGEMPEVLDLEGGERILNVETVRDAVSGLDTFRVWLIAPDTPAWPR